MPNRYDVSGLTEAQFEPGSNDEVLKNLIGIKNSDAMDLVEAKSLALATDAMIHEFDAEHRFTADDICHMHKSWLGGIYEWAGEYRQVNIAKGGFQFAMSDRVPQLMEQFSREPLAKYTPCVGMDRQEVVKALAEVHVEFELIHPFREGMGE